MSASSQYYGYLPSIKDLVTVLGQRFCRKSGPNCLSHFLKLSTATYMDIDYDTISGALVINAGWPSAPDPEGWTETTTRLPYDGTVEIGVLMHEQNPDPEDVQFGGFLTTLGQDTKPSTYVPPSLTVLQLISTSRTNPLPNPHPPLPPPHRILLLIRPPSPPPPNLHHLLPTPHRPPPNPHPLLPLLAPCSPSPDVQTAHAPHPPLLPLHRQIPIHRPPLPLLQAPRLAAQPRGRHRPRSPRLGYQSLGQRRAI